jgi:ParB/RepB/Spo0J family partition protein
MPSTVDIPLTHVLTRRDARKIDDAAVRGLVESIGEIGIINPLRVRPVRRHVEGVEADAFEVTAGGHRLRAARKLGLEVVPCIVVEDDDLHAELAMIDENLCRAELSPADRAAQTARRKVIYVELHPETAKGVAGGLARHGAAADNLSFAVDTAIATGKDRRTIERDAERGEKVCAEAIELVRGTDLDKGSYLDKLKKLEPAEQVATVNRALGGLARAAERERAEAADKRNQTRIEADVRKRAAREVADILALHIPPDLWDGLKANLYAAKASAIADEFTNIIGPAVMDQAA